MSAIPRSAPPTRSPRGLSVRNGLPSSKLAKTARKYNTRYHFVHATGRILVFPTPPTRFLKLPHDNSAPTRNTRDSRSLHRTLPPTHILAIQATHNPFGALDSDDEGDAPITTPKPATTIGASKASKANKSKPAPAPVAAKSDSRSDARPRRDGGGGRGGGRGAGRGEGRGAGGRGRYGDGGGERTGPERESYDDRRRDRG